MRRSLRLLAGTAAVVFSVVATAVVSGGSASSSPLSVPVPTLSWHSCEVIFQCASAQAPLDYHDPGGQQISLGLIREPASDPSQRIGSLFVSPGGLAMQMTSGPIFPGIVAALGPDVRKRFDIVGIDPRGGGQSAPFHCSQAPGVTPVPAPADPYPEPGEYQQKIAYDSYVNTSCAATGGSMLNHLTTADNARDLDLMRQAVGDKQLTYYGISYGGFLGETYAAMFPDKVRAMAIDAVLDPVAWATGRNGDHDPMSKRTMNAEASENSLAAAFAQCDKAGPAHCPISGNALGRWDRVLASLTTKPLTLPGGITLTDQGFIELTNGILQIEHIGGVNILDGFSALAALTRAVEVIRFGPADNAADNAANNATLSQAASLTRQLTSNATTSTEAADGNEAGRGAQCEDSVNPKDENAWITAGENYPQAPRFGAMDTWSSSGCAGWPGTSADAYLGPFTATTSTPLLFINNTYDPVTPMAGAQAASALYPGSRLIQVDTWGHSALGKSSRCLAPATNAYLIDRTLPPEGLRCAPDQGLWGLAP